MGIKLFYNVLDNKRKAILPLLAFLKKEFYLAGGTGISLQMGHRISVDFDYFTKKKFSNQRLIERLEQNFPEARIERIQDVTDTLTIILANTVKISFFRTPYKNILPLVDTPHFKLLPAEEIGAMKIIALTRAEYKDYVDIYFLLKKYGLNSIMKIAHKKYKTFDEGIYLKCLLSYSDIKMFPVKYQAGKKKPAKEIFAYIEKKTKEYIRRLSIDH